MTTSIKILIIFTVSLLNSFNYIFSQYHGFRNSSLSTDERAALLLKELTLDEKIGMMGYVSPAITRLQIPAYNWWNEALHGVARAGKATVFPQAIAMASTFDSLLVYKVADAISTEARSKYNLSTSMGRHIQYMGINFWSPNINIFRDPRWGRGQETYGEDPFLTGKMGKAFVSGLQGNIAGKLKTAAAAKHFAVHSGPEGVRHYFNATVDEKDLRETYLPAFKTLVNNNVEAIMCAYNRVNGEPCCTGETLLKKILRNEWGFKGQVVTDCWALDDIWLRHKTIPSRVEVAAAAIKAGVNLDCANILQADINQAISMGLITEQDLNLALLPNLKTQIKLGFYDNPEEDLFSSYGRDSISNTYHIELAKKAAVKSMVLLKNNGLLPLKKENTGSIMVVGENAASISALTGNYHGLSENMVTFVEGIVKATGPETAIQYDLGCNYIDTVNFGGIWAAGFTDVVVAVLGLNPLLEGEHGDAFLSNSGGDKVTLSIPRSHILFLKKMRESVKKPVITVLTGGSALNINEIEPYSDAIIMAWYPGEQGGNALSEIIFGNESPSGRLPVTFYNSIDDLPDYSDYSMNNRTYRYFKGDVKYPFGYGLSYTSFSYSWVKKPLKKYSNSDVITIDVKIKNTGNYNANEVVQVYIGYPGIERMPLAELKGFSLVPINKGEEKLVSIKIPVNELQKWDLKSNKWKLYSGQYNLYVSKNAKEHILVESFRIK